jgi:hypothetical protein
VPEVYASLFNKSTGVSGKVRMIAPFPESEVNELPKTLVAINLA